MKISNIIIASILVIAFSGIATQSTQASNSYLTPYVTAVTYQNVGSLSTNRLTFYFYNSQDANYYFSYSPTQQQLAAKASGSFYMGNLILQRKVAKAW